MQLRVLPFHAILCALALSSASAQSVSDSTVTIAPTPDGANVDVTVIDASNSVWRIESSADFNTWTPVETIKLHNGRLARRYSTAGTARVFFRAFYDPAQQNLTSSVETALKLPQTPFNYSNPALPPAFLVNPILGQDNTPAANPITNAGATLGRVLFYDKRLSANQTVSCSSCHQQGAGFSDPRQFSVGFQGGLTGRNSMGLAHARWYQRRAFFWDERAATLEDQVLQPIQNAVEMGMTLPDLVNRLSAEPYYATLFTSAFGTPVINSDRISRALAQFVRSIVSVQSKYDQGVTQNFTNFTAEENNGRAIFNQPTRGNCAACHGTDNFVPGPAINNNGLENPYVDKGVGALTGRPQDEGLFKVPSLRNIELTAPYMHDGRFPTLDAVVNFYNAGVVNHPNLSPPLRGPGGQPRRLNLSQADRNALVAFLRTLTDNNLATNPIYSDPFNYGP
ncbi:MAG: c-type cytochrome [Verrucomicrobia bacterium]|nr:c-type cytochrome [Verrucomicrobiota bacterium]